MYQHGRSCILFRMARFPSHCLGCVSGCVHTLVKPSSGQASRREVYPPGPSLMVLGTCGYCGVAHVWLNGFPHDDMTVKRVLTAQRIWLDYDSDTCIHTRIVFVTSTARHAFLVWRWAGRLYPEPFYLLLLRFWALRMVSSTRAQKTYSPGRKSLNSQTRKCRYRHHRNRLGYRVMLWGWLVTYYNTSCNDMIYTVLSIQM